MADIVTFPCNYLVINSGYTGRLFTEEKIDALEDFSAEYGVIPLYAKDSNWGTGEIQPFIVHRGVIVQNHPAAPEALLLFENLQRRLENNGLSSNGVIVFRVGNFDNATKVFTNFTKLEFCALFNVDNIKLLKNETTNDIEIIYVSFDSESG